MTKHTVQLPSGGTAGFDSKEELDFFHWCMDAVAEGIIARLEYHTVCFRLAERVSVPHMKVLKTKTKLVEKFLLHPAEYTPDFVLQKGPHWYLAQEQLWSHPEDGECYVDVKGQFSPFHDDKSFSLVQKWVWQRHGKYINKVVPAKFFKKLWCPDNCRIGKSGKELKAYKGLPTREDFRKGTINK